VVKLTVRDNQNAASPHTLIISANNTPPVVNITSPVKNSFYNLGADTLYALRATVSDAQHTASQLFYQWQTVLRHNIHQHAEPVDTNRNASAMISRIGCNGDSYYWFIKLTVTDAAGLSTVDSSRIYPYCGGPLTATLGAFTVLPQGNTNVINWVTVTEINMSYFLVERSYDGVNFSSLGRVNAQRAPGLGSYEWRDDNHLPGYNYYRLRMVDIGGQSRFSSVVRVYTGNYKDNKLLVSPNPVTGPAFVAGFNFSRSEKVTLRIIDMNGKTIAIQKEQAHSGFNSFTIQRPLTAGKGVYLLELVTETITYNAKLIIAN